MQRVIQLGSKVEDVVTGFKGIASSRAIHMNGCDRYWIQPAVGKDGKHPDGAWFDVVSLKVVGAPIKIPGDQNEKQKTGGFPSSLK